MKQAHWLVLTLFFTLHGVAQTITLYDNFDHKFLNPSRWAYALCYSGSGLEMECVREIRDEQLHLAHRYFGVQANDGGQQNPHSARFESQAGSWLTAAKVLTTHARAEPWPRKHSAHPEKLRTRSASSVHAKRDRATPTMPCYGCRGGE